MRKIETFLILALCSLAATAQEELPLEPLETEDVRQYTVEIIIFSYEENVSVGTEIFIPDEPPQQEDSLLDIDAADAGFGDEVETPFSREERSAGEDGDEANSPVRELELVLLKEEELTLDKIARQFALLDVYETIMYFGWTQPTYPEAESAPIELRVFGDPPEGLDGSFTLYLSRYLHLVVDLALDAPEDSDDSAPINQPVYSDDPTYSFGDTRPRYGDVYPRLPLPTRYRIQEDRIVKNGELRYFDHPKFGVLAKITRVEEEDEDLSESELPEPLLGSAR